MNPPGRADRDPFSLDPQRATEAIIKKLISMHENRKLPYKLTHLVSHLWFKEYKLWGGGGGGGGSGPQIISPIIFCRINFV